MNAERIAELREELADARVRPQGANLPSWWFGYADMLDEIERLRAEVDVQEAYIDMLEKTMAHRMAVLKLDGAA